MLNCNTNVIPRLSSWGKCQLLQAKAIGKVVCVNLTKKKKTQKEVVTGLG